MALYVNYPARAEELAKDALVRLCQHWPRVREMADRRACHPRESSLCTVGLTNARGQNHESCG